MSFPGMETLSTWILHPGTYEMVWWVLICVVWYGFIIELRVKRIQQQLDELTAERDKQDAARS